MRDYKSIGIKNATPVGNGLFKCPAVWIPERTYDLAQLLDLIDSDGNVLLTAEWANKTHHARGICDTRGKEYRIPDHLPTTY